MIDFENKIVVIFDPIKWSSGDDKKKKCFVVKYLHSVGCAMLCAPKTKWGNAKNYNIDITSSPDTQAQWPHAIGFRNLIWFQHTV